MLLLIPQEESGQAFDELVDRYEKRIYNLIFRLVGDRDDAADLTQETFVAAFKAYGSFRGGSSTYTWLCRIAMNKCKNRFRARDREREMEGLSLEVDSLQETVAAPERYDPEQSLQRAEFRRYVEQAIERLPDDYRVVAVLRDLHGLSYQEIAEVADLSVEVVKTRLARARAMLRRCLEPYMIIE